MGGWMTYQRVRARNGLLFRKPEEDPDPYWRVSNYDARIVGLENVEPQRQADLRHSIEERNLSMLIGDMNRMERDYLAPRYPVPPWAGREPGSDPLSQVVAATGVDAESVKRVLRYVFMEQP